MTTEQDDDLAYTEFHILSDRYNQIQKQTQQFVQTLLFFETHFQSHT